MLLTGSTSPKVGPVIHLCFIVNKTDTRIMNTRPRHFLTVTAIPHTPTGKIARQEALRLATEA